LPDIAIAHQFEMLVPVANVHEAPASDESQIPP
jgi:hypothetical protein